MLKRLHFRRRLRPTGFLVFLLPVVLACNFFTGTESGQNNGQIRRISQLPTLTPTAAVEANLPPAAPSEQPVNPASPVESITPRSTAVASQALPATVPSPPTSAPIAALPWSTPPPQTASQPIQTSAPAPPQTIDEPVVVDSSDPQSLTEPVPAAIVIPTATPATGPVGWTFVNIATYPDEFEDGVILYGDVINETGSAQEVSFISGTFYDDAGQVLADTNSAIDYWPIDTVPAGARLPFEISLPGVESTARFQLTLEAQPHTMPIQQHFEVVNLTQQESDAAYCLSGQVKNQGEVVQEFLVIMAVLYDSQDQMINFGEFYASDPAAVIDGQFADFEICIEPVVRRVARHELRVWGQ